MLTPHRRARTAVSIVVALAIALPLGACKEEEDFLTSNPVDFLMLIFAGATPKKKEKLEHTEDVQFSGSIGGLTGTFDVDVGSWGSLGGVAKIKGLKKAKLNQDGGDNENALIEAAVSDTLGVDIDVTDSKFKFNGSQTTGGVVKKFNVKVTFEGTVASGENVGKRVKGKFKTKGKF
jgi:hypothetical protein